MAAVFANNDQRLVDYSDNRETTPLVPVTGNSVASSPAPSPAPPSAIPVFLPTILFLTAASMAGVLARHGLRVITGPDGAKMAKDEDPLFPDVWSNMIGSFLMGIVGVVLKRDLTQWYGPLQVALGTGFCGSLTTFSAWNHQTVRMFDTRRPGAAIMCIIVGLALPYASLALGVGAGHAMAPTVQVSGRSYSLHSFR